tara:strand:+ start:68 stop:724 length:657 start_codon:yes stop_codon:yes gene_type:complete
MKTYIRVLGILNLITCLGLLGLWTFGLFQLLEDEPEDLWILLLLAIPLYSLIHFVIFHRFGFNYKAEFTKSQRVAMVSLAIVFGLSFLLLIIPNIVRFNATLNQNEKLAEPLTLGVDTTAYGYTASLTTKYLNGKINYQFQTLSSEPFKKDRPTIPTFTIELYDEDGFFIDQIVISNYSRNVDGVGNVTGISANSNQYIDSDDYKRIAKWGLMISKSK